LGGKKFARKTAERLKGIVEEFLYYRRNEIEVPAKKVEQWLQNAPDEIKAKLVKAGLITLHEPQTCKQLWDAFFKFKSDVKLNTVQIYKNCQTRFFEAFSPEEPIGKITTERLFDWRTSMLAKYEEAGVATHIKTIKTVLNWAVKQKWLTESPARNVPTGSFRNRKNDRTITMEEYAKLLDACPNQEWRTIIALARIGGLRCSSELQRFRWSDIRWAENRILVRSPKTERHEGHRERLVPLFPKLRAELERHFSLVETKGNEFVIQGLQNSRWNLHTPFRTIAKRAGLGTIVRPFDNMRMSRSNEVDREFGSLKESLWIGHSEKVKKEHYYRLEDSDFAEAAGASLESQNHPAQSHAKPTVMGPEDDDEDDDDG
jgi:integrase